MTPLDTPEFGKHFNDRKFYTVRNWNLHPFRLTDVQLLRLFAIDK